MSIDQQLNSIFSSVFGIDPSRLSESDSAETIDGWDSVNHIQLVLAIEAEFGIKFNPNDIPQLNSYRRIRDAVTSLQT